MNKEILHKSGWNIAKIKQLWEQIKSILSENLEKHTISITKISELPEFLQQLKTCHDINQRKELFLKWHKSLCATKSFKVYTKNIDLILTNTTCLPLENLVETLEMANKVELNLIQHILFKLKITDIKSIHRILEKLTFLDKKILKNIQEKYWKDGIWVIINQELIQIEKINNWEIDISRLIEFRIENILRKI